MKQPVPFSAKFRAEIMRKLPYDNATIFHAFRYRPTRIKQWLTELSSGCEEYKQLLQQFNTIVDAHEKKG